MATGPESAPEADDLQTADRGPRRDPSDQTWLVVSASSGVTCVPLPAQELVTLGRSPGCDVRVEDDSVSRNHSLVRRAEAPGAIATLTIEDAGSRNGTAVSGRWLASGERCALEVGSVVQLGSATIVLLRAAPALAASLRDASVTGSTHPAPLVLDPAMQRIYALLDVIAQAPLNVLVLGETGTGKEVFAAEVHARSPRAKKPFLKLNCATMSGSLLESELFGHEKGAFTGAATAKAGLFEAGNGGTIFLDEIGELPLDTQAKLLRVLDTGEVLRLGSVTPRTIDVRYVAATNRDLHVGVAEGRFRSDLLFRLNGFEITLPPLRKRHAEVLALAELFLDRAASQAKKRPPVLSSEARSAILGHAWPGNVRELRTTMERAFALAGASGTIGPEQLMLRAATPEPKDAATSINDFVAAEEKERVLDALRRAHGNQTEAAKLLGVSRRTIITKIEVHGIDRPRKDARRPGKSR